MPTITRYRVFLTAMAAPWAKRCSKPSSSAILQCRRAHLSTLKPVNPRDLELHELSRSPGPAKLVKYLFLQRNCKGKLCSVEPREATGDERPELNHQTAWYLCNVT